MKGSFNHCAQPCTIEAPHKKMVLGKRSKGTLLVSERENIELCTRRTLSPGGCQISTLGSQAVLNG
jgi:hypothetical protein